MANAQTYDRGELEIKTISLDGLMRVESHIARSKDLDLLDQPKPTKQGHQEHGQRADSGSC